MRSLKRPLSLLIGMMFIGTVPSVAHAEALSPWVRGILARTGSGVTYSDSLSSEACGNETRLSDIEALLNTVREFHTPALDLETESRFLRENTVCFEYDRRLLMEQQKLIRDKMEKAALACRTDAMRVLTETYRFTSEALVSLTKGGLDPGYRDDRLLSRHIFESQGAWDRTESPPDPDSTPVCPYTTDYGPHSVGYIPVRLGQGATTGQPSFDVRSFGCDAEILRCLGTSPNGDLPPNCSRERADAVPAVLKAEARTLAEYIDAVQSFAGALYGTLSEALSLTGPAPTLPSPLVHAERSGCLRPLSPLDDGGPDPASVDALLMTFPDYFEPGNLRSEEIAPRTERETYSPKAGLELPIGILFHPVTDFFQSRASAPNLILNFFDKRAESGRTRPLPSIYGGQGFDTSMFLLWRTMDSRNLPTITANMERESANLDAWHRDSIERMQSITVPLNDAVRSLVEVTEEFLPNEYIPQYAYFLSRSCVDGHCQKTLETVAKRAFNPYCHPYASGKYTDPKAHLKCFCDPSIANDFPDWNTYCSNDFSSDMQKYAAMTAKLIPACMPDPGLK